jgi:hypothetical protein
MIMLRPIITLLLSTVLLIGWSGEARSQLGVGQSGSSSLSFMSSEEGMRELVAFGRCYARANREQALALIGTSPTSREELQVYRRLFGRADLGCLAPGTTMNVSPGLVRGVIAEGLVREGGALPSTHLLRAPGVGEVRNLSDASRCYAARHVTQVQALLGTRPGSRAEFDHLSRLWPEFSACLPPGVRANYDVTLIRFRLAEALLRLNLAAAAAPGRSN